MKAGELKHRIVIQQDTGATQDDSGHVIPKWTRFAEVWAAVEPLNGRELWNAQQVQPQITTRIRIRYREGVKPHMQVIFRGATLDIDSVIDLLSAREEMHLMCKEVVS